MSRTYDNEKKPSQSTFSFKPTASFLQTRGFAPIQTDLEEDAPPRPSGYTENFLEKIFNQRSIEPSDTSVQAKPMNRLKRPLQDKRISVIQAKLNIGEPNDKYEQESDDTASKVVQQINSTSQDQSVQKQESMEEEDEELQMKPISSIQRETMEEEEELQMKSLVQRRENLGGGEASTDLESSIQSARGSGQSLDPNLQAKMGQAMGADFSGVKVHTDSQSDQLNKSIQAKAFTTGQDLFFRQGAYEPNSRSGQELIAHELTHVVQQNSGASVVQRERFIGVEAQHHLHIEIHQDHYKFARDDGSRIEIGKNGNYKLDQLIVARNHLVNNNYTANGGQACITWLEQECQDHSDWDEGVGYQPSWEVEEVDENQHTEGILEHGKSFGYERADFENTLIQSKNEVLEDEIRHVNDGNYYGQDVDDGEDATAKKLEEFLESVTLLDLLPQWSGFPEDIYSKDDLAEYFKRASKEHLRLMLLDQFPLSTGKYEE